MKVSHRIRMSQADAHYGGNLVDGARLMALFGDVATEMLIRLDGDEGLFRAYESVEFLAPVYAGDFLEVAAELVHQGNSSRKISFSVHKYISPICIQGQPSAADALDQPILVAKALGTCVVPKNCQRLKKGGV